MIRILVILTCVLGPMECLGAEKPKFLPPAGKRLVFVSGALGTSELKDYEKVCPPPSGRVAWTKEGWRASAIYYQGGGAPAALLVHQSLVLGKQSFYADILAGKCDAEIDAFGDACRAVRRPVFVVLGGEVDFEQEVHCKDFTPDQFKRAYRYIRERWERRRIDNVAYCLHLAACFRGTIEDFYPGDDLVDWIGISLYNNGNLKQGIPAARFAKAHGKGFMIAESEPFEVKNGKTDYDAWFRPYFAFIRKYDVRATHYNNFDRPVGKMGFGNSHVKMLSAPVRTALGKELREDEYLRPGSELYRLLGYRE